MINIYRASAGAGKTHKLTGEYLKLLFSDYKKYSRILAVTFTNKATDEMKQRILLELYNLASVSNKSDYIAELCALYGKTEFEIRGEAKKILLDILYDYTAFSISTIDKFFQKVMRAFARELGRNITYDVELDTKKVLTTVVDTMFSELDLPQNKDLLNWLINYSVEAVENGNTWNVKKEIISLGSELFQEAFKLKKNGTFENIYQFKITLIEIKKRFPEDLFFLINKGAVLIKNAGLEYSNFKGGSRSIFNYFDIEKFQNNKTIPLPKDSFNQLHNNVDKWITGKNFKAQIEGVYSSGLNDCIGDIITLFETRYKLYVTACIILSNVNALGILDELYSRILKYCKEKNIMLISESTELLNKIIGKDDTPFIYEKIGGRIDNFMLDEFQDTSLLQWKNFVPLLSNSLAQGNDNLIVGDVKQSIYRWRGSDWNILNSKVYDDFDSSLINDYNLEYNWRSSKNIVDFTNAFFSFCANTVQDTYDKVLELESSFIKDIYADFQQKVPAKKNNSGGYVEVNIIEASEDGKDEVLNLLPDRINSLLKEGVSKKDIAILVRKRDEGRIVASKLISNNIDVISNDSLFIGASVAVQKIILTLRIINHPLQLESGYSNMFKQIFGNTAYIPEDMQGKSIYECCEEIIRESFNDVEKSELPYIQAFLDCALDFSLSEGANLQAFLKWWDELGVGKTISAPEDADAINIMTIHKSKGLGFNVVIIPFFEEKLEKSNDRIWTNLENSEELKFDAPLPVSYNNDLKNSLFSSDYFKEKLFMYVDNLNTAYVACTRPKEQLIIYAQSQSVTGIKDKKITSIKDALHTFFRENKIDGVEKVSDNIITTYKIGEPDKKDALNIDLISTRNISVFDSEMDYAKTRVALTTDSINDEDSIRNYGIAMHYIFSLIKTVDDIENAVNDAVNSGVYSGDTIFITNQIKEIISGVDEYGWFNDGLLILNERDIIKPNGLVCRPDRLIINGESVIVVDYKFGKYKEESMMINKYKRQIAEYTKLLYDLGYSDVKSFIWYPLENIVL